MIVYSIYTRLRGVHGDVHVIVAAGSHVKAADLIGISVRDVKSAGEETKNRDLIAQAMTEPGVVFIQDANDRNSTWRKYEAPQ
jgi:hypothetical protein